MYEKLVEKNMAGKRPDVWIDPRHLNSRDKETGRGKKLLGSA